jgi:hypothetical protein
MGNMKAVYTLAEALMEPESWLHQYSRNTPAHDKER